MKNIFFSFLILSLGAPLFGQYQGDLLIKYSPSGLFDYYAQYAQLSGEYVFSDAQSIELEGGFAFGESFWRENPEILFDQGVKIRGGWRKYLRQNSFAGVLLSFRDEQFSIEADFERFNSSFFERLAYDVDQQQYALLGQWGFFYPISRRFTFEYSSGMGLRAIVRNYSGVPEDANFITNNTLFAQFSRETERIVQLSLFLSIKFGFVLSKSSN
jgi:hypothetical protein